ncbi:MAG: spermidine acetyltransferase [Anaerolineaceae bacterium]|nr:spermidine acetyltransferase [Anaerolineaceae bacterium]
MVELRPVTKKNFEAIINLEVSQIQQKYVASNLFSIAESKIYPECIPLGIYVNDTPVGFLMYAFNADDESYWVCRLMVDRYFQGKGYGKQALKLVMDEIRKRPTCNHIKLSIEPGNMSAQKIYESLGFKKTGELVEGEEVMRLDFDVED